MKSKRLIICLATLVTLGACKRTSRDEQFAREARQFTEKQCPHEVDFCTRLDSTTYDIPSHTYAYHYTLYGELDDARLYTDEIKARHREKVLSEIRSSIQMRSFKEAGITLLYRWNSEKTGNVLFELSFTKEDYAQ